MPRLNYSKWDALEVSDDSDIEGHPNVDKKSLIRWKQRDIHEKREARKAKIAHLKQEIILHDVLLPRLEKIAKGVESNGRAYYSSLVERLKTQPSDEAPDTGVEGQPTYDQMVHSLLLKVWEEVKEKGITKDDPKLDGALVAGIREKITRLEQDKQTNKEALVKEEEEQARKITSEDIHEGFDSKYVPPKPEPTPITPKPKETKKKKVTETSFETLNAPAVSTDELAVSVQQEEHPEPTDVDGDDEEGDSDDDGEELPELTPSLQEFSKLPYRGYDQSWRFIQAHRDVIVPGATDALLVEAFSAERRGEKKYSKQCVHQGLLLQYCDKLGRDGVSLFFKRMIADEKRAQAVFLKDVEDTYAHLAKRVEITNMEELRGREQIQLMQEDPLKPISFNVPSGPPPETIAAEDLQDLGVEDEDPEAVRRALQMRWDIFQSLSQPLQKALQKESLDAINKVLGKMEVADAEEIVKLMQMSGMLNLADEVRDLTKGDNPFSGASETEGN